MSGDASRIAEVRAFNRFYARIGGALDAGPIVSPYSLAEARVLHEVATRGNTTAAELSRHLGADPAYLSRLLAKLTQAGLLAVTPNTRDRRQHDIGLTPRGKTAVAGLDAAADAAVAALLAPLGAPSRQALVSAMATIRAAFGDTMPAAPVIVRPHRVGEVSHVVGRQGQLYAAEHGWDATYEGLAAEIAGKFLQDFDPGCECCLIAERRGEIVGSVFVVYAGEGIGQLRLLYVEPAARGLGIGRTLVEEAIRFARASGYARMTLWTQTSLLAARSIYAATGFTSGRQEPHTSFGKDLVGEYWELELQ